MRHDFRVTVLARFTVDVGADSPADANRWADVMTRSVFKNDYGRAENLDVEVLAVHQVAPVEPTR